MVQYFTRNDIIRLLRLLAADLDARGIEAEIRLIGGAALAIRYFERALTTDIDAALFPESAILELSEEFAVKEGFSLTWLNSDAKIFIPGYGDSPEWFEVFRHGGVKIFVPTARALLAMKLNAARPGKDERDVAYLLALTHTQTIDEAQELFESFYPGDVISLTGLAILERVYSVGLPEKPIPFENPFGD